MPEPVEPKTTSNITNFLIFLSPVFVTLVAFIAGSGAIGSLIIGGAFTLMAKKPILGCIIGVITALYQGVLLPVFVVSAIILGAIVSFVPDDESCKSKPRRGGRYTPELTSRQSVFGIAGGHIAEGSSTFGDKAAIGAEGERRVGAMLDKLAEEYPQLRIAHGCRFNPNGGEADVDHVAIIGRNVFLIDAKNWKPDTYKFIPSGEVYRSNSPFAGGEVHMAAAVDYWRDDFNRYADRPVTVSSIITLAGKYQNGYKFNGPTQHSNLRLATIRDLENFLRSMLAGSDNTVHRDVLWVVLKNRM